MDCSGYYGDENGRAVGTTPALHSKIITADRGCVVQQFLQLRSSKS